MDVKIPVVTIEEETASDLSNEDQENASQSPLRESNNKLPEKWNGENPSRSQQSDDTDCINRSHPAKENDEKSPLLQQNNLTQPSIKKGRFTVSKSPDISKSDFYSANIESVFQDMEPPKRGTKNPKLKVDIEKAMQPRDDPEKENVPEQDNSKAENVTVVVEDEINQPGSRKSNKLFTVINYGNVSAELMPMSPGSSAKSGPETFEWPKRESHGSQLLRELFEPPGKLTGTDQPKASLLPASSQGDGRKSSFLSHSKLPMMKPRVRLVSGTQSFDVDDSLTDDVLSDRSLSPKSSLNCSRPQLRSSIPDMFNNNKPDPPLKIHHDTGKDVADYKDSQGSVHGSAGYLSKTLLDVARRGRLFAKRKTGRLVTKDGTPNITLKHIKTKHQMFMLDIFTTVLDMKWRWVLLVFCVAFIFSWLGFAGELRFLQ